MIDVYQMTERRFIHVKRYKQGAKWADGGPRMCVRCGVLVSRMERTRRNQAVLTAVDVTSDSRMPVGYCADHIPDELREE